MKGIGAQGEMSSLELGKPIMNQDTGEIEYQNDLSSAKFDVTVDVGPSSSSKRAATVRTLMGLMQIVTDPETIQVITSKIMVNLEDDGMTDTKDFFRKRLVRMGVGEPTDEEREELAAELEQLQSQPDPQSMYLQAEAAKAQAQAQKALADTEYTMARTEETRADTIETLAGIERKERENVLNTAEQLQRVVQGSQIRQPPSRV